MGFVGTTGLLKKARGKLMQWRLEHRQSVPGGPAPRVPVRLSLDITGYEKHLTGSSRNLAMGGMLLEADGQLSIGEPVEICFKLPGGPEINIPGVVCRKQNPMLAVRFDVTDPQRELIQQWVETQLQHAS